MMVWFRDSQNSPRIYAKFLFWTILVVGVLQSMVVREIQ